MADQPNAGSAPSLEDDEPQLPQETEQQTADTDALDQPFNADLLNRESDGEQGSGGEATDEPGDSEGLGGGDENGEPDHPGIAGFSAAEIKQLLEQAAQVGSLAHSIRELHGRYGELKSALTKKAEPRKLTRDQLKRVADEYGEEYADALAADLSEVLTSPAQVDIEGLVKAALAEREAEIEQRVTAKMERAAEERFLNKEQPGWRDIMTSQDFSLWESLQPESVIKPLQEAFTTKPYSEAVVGALNAFNGWKTEREARLARRRELERAVIRKGNGAAGAGKKTGMMSAADAADAAYRDARGG